MTGLQLAIELLKHIPTITLAVEELMKTLGDEELTQEDIDRVRARVNRPFESFFE